MNRPKDDMKRRTYRCWLPVMLVAACAAAVGCSSNSSFTLNPFAKRKGPEPDRLPAARWQELKRENAARLAGEGIPRSAASTRPAAPPPSTLASFDSFLDSIEYVVWTLPKRAIKTWTGETPAKYAKMMEDDQSGDHRREGVLRLAADYDFARAEPYTKRYWQIAQGDPDVLVRLAAVRALDRSRDPSVTPLAIRYLDDQSPLMRLEAAKALANVPDEKAIPGLTRHIAAQQEVRGEGGRPEAVPESRDVRVACADALRNFPNKEVARTLVDALREREFEVSWQARKSLILMTGHDFKYDQAKWREYLAGTDNPFG
jgi:hypothetical protein